MGLVALLAVFVVTVAAFAATSASAKPQAGQYILGVSNTLVGNGWRDEMICAVKAQATASGTGAFAAFVKETGPLNKQDRVDLLKYMLDHGVDLWTAMDRTGLKPQTFDEATLRAKVGEAIAANPKAVLQKHLSDGKKVVGCFPIYTPEELVHAGGMIPMGLWGGQVSPAVAGRYNPIFTCSIMRSCLEYGMTDVYKGLSCVIMPMLCDTFRGMSAGWRAGVRDIPLVAFIHPQNWTDSGAAEFLAGEYRAVRELLEKFTGCKITDQALEKSIEIYNEH
jgi:hypothetical protein